MLIILILFVSVCAFLLLVVLSMIIFSAKQRTHLNRYRSKAKGMVDLLNFSHVIDDGVVLGKNGALMAAWIFEGADQASATVEERNQVVRHLNRALMRLEGGWTLHIDVIRQQSAAYSEQISYFTDKICEEIERRRRAFFQDHGNVCESCFVLAVSWLPPLLAKTKLVDLMYDEEKNSPKKNYGSQLLTQFKQNCDVLENQLSIVFKLSRLKSRKIYEKGEKIVFDDFLQHLNLTVTGNNHPIRLPENPMHLDNLLGGQEFYTGDIPKLGKNFIRCVSIDSFPMMAFPNMLSSLAELPLNYRWSSRFIFLDNFDAKKQLDTYRKQWKQKQRGFMDQVLNLNSTRIDQDAVEMTQDAEAALAEVSSDLVAAGYYSNVIVLMDEDKDKLENSVRFLEKHIQRLGFNARIETINTVEAYLGSLPGHTAQNVRRPLINTANLACFLPTSSIWTGHPFAPCPLYEKNLPPLMQVLTTGCTPFRFNLHVEDVGHTLLFGPTGSGKSVHLGLLAAQFRRYEGLSLFVFDKGMSMFALCKAASGQHFTVGADDSQMNFAPLQQLDSKEDIAWAQEWLTAIFQLNGVALTPSQNYELARALIKLSLSKISRTLTDLRSLLQDKILREVLNNYTTEGPMGYLLDAREDTLSLSTFSVFEIEALMEMGQKFGLPVLLYLFRRIECALKGQPAVIILDEAWLMLSHPVFREKIREWLKVLRKANCSVILATQSLTDAANSGILDVLVESTSVKIFLPNSHAHNDSTKELYRQMGLNDRQITIIADAIPKREYYYTSKEGNRLYELALDDYTLAFIGASDKKSVARIKTLIDTVGDDWVNKWLLECGVIKQQEAA